MGLKHMKIGHALIVAGAGTAMLAVVAGTNNIEAANPDLSSIENSTSIQYQVPDSATQMQKDCYKTKTEVSLAQYYSVNSKAKGHELAMKSCGIKH